ncbi:bifunctional adenosylcobinamide kinase/adenosylcobinamide-phosphate guanylyltransferase [Pseudonocardia parietis]|uniref:Nicotinate-nucleotide--dimethylbenzimidazole phosphoribosyltransferase n=1 Tax=Pseudonocardia parietis TaxID=570936 RepID=A0ABS4VTT5_9PSEU|nr:bifunctional adenosylcobinamide kinase/adenosylcobinamide-phosphate guanylyltransferase [Pseudonocardia parietis]MBP2367196.1 nicotinate-nucleotide--dimethylbenzimidazole phosphoribosyltransferase [Pseudonocardia parietis]
MNATLVIGGTRSGKSRYAERLFGEATAVRYLATARRISGDTEWDARIAAHTARRPSSWTTEEIGSGPALAAALASGGPVLVDDLATWLTGVLDDAGAWERTGDLPEVDDAVAGLVEAVAAAPGPVVLVSAETGLGVVPESRSGRLFRDRLGELNAALAAVCPETVLVVAGRALRLPSADPVGATSAAGLPVAGLPAADAAESNAASSGGDVHGTPAGVPGAVSPTSTEAPVPATATGSHTDDTAGPIVPTAVGRPDLRSRREAVALVDGLAMPTGGLGRLGELGVWLASCQAQCPPRPPLDARVLLLAADHGIAAAGVSAYPPEISAVRATAAAAGRLPVTVAARAAGAAVRTVDVGLTDGADGVESGYVVARGTGRIDREDALTPEGAEAAWRTGRLLADEEIAAGADVLVPASLAVGVTTPAATLIAALTGAEPVAVVGRASGIDDRAWMRKAVAIRDALRRARPHVRDPLALLRTVGGTDLVVLAGFLARAAERKVPAVLDGVAVGAAALLAEELAPGAKEWWLAAQPSTEPAAGLVLEHLSLTPLLDLAVRTEDGTAGVSVLPLLVSAARLLAETGTAEGTGVVPGGVTAAAGAGR